MKTRIVKVGNIEIGRAFTVMAGPCSVESLEQFMTIAQSVKTSGAVILRGGLFKMRTNPKSFQGLGHEAFSLIKEVKEKTQLPFISEITDPRHIEDLINIVDVFQVGSRNMYNYSLLKELGKTDKPVMLKRGFSALIDEWLMSAQYIENEGNNQVILCERGIRSFDNKTRNVLDLNAVAYIKANHSYPIITDPSHGVGVASLVPHLALAAAAVGTDGLLVEVHHQPENALSDGFQALNCESFKNMMDQLEKVLHALDKPLEATLPISNESK